ncbi:hypothetical protein H0266_13845 [Halobacillus locisalis]|uniref:Uncharacterized protein n=1 Tax=Halobacillus locisalis TaxID=220753 RepID=A0A838CW40_9BACI|nr:hypothetical protein [Halobacillus locisalis]MBA2175975.1 hypothetical protein [Halobacillus locisalis]
MDKTLIEAIEELLDENGVKVKDASKTSQDPYYYKTHKDERENSVLTIR